jgi:hypothetical protein
MSEDIRSTVSREIEDFKVYLISHAGTSYDITTNVSNFVCFESLFEKALSANMTIADNRAMVSTIPVIGQEVIAVTYVYKDTEVDLVFRVNRIEDIKQVNDNGGVYVLRLVSDKVYKSAVNLFSRSYRGKNTEIIAKIHEDFLESPVEVLSNGGTSHRIAYPYTKPYAAIDAILSTTYAEDKTPLFLYETLNNNSVKLQSYGDMISSEENPVVLINANMINTDPDGQVRRDLPSQNKNVFDQVIKRGYQTFDNVRKGAFAAFVTSIDISGKVYSEERFDYKEHAPNLSPNLKDYIGDSFTINEESPNALFNSRQIYFQKDSLAYESSDVGNLYQVDDLSRAAMMSYRARMANQFVALAADSNPDLQVGKMVELNFRRMKPNLDSEEDIDLVNSGQYLCTGIKHQIRQGKYSVIIEAQRFGINKEAEI